MVWREHAQPTSQSENFQYSLCRVVLMVEYCHPRHCACRFFQYSLCRVVLMVTGDSVAIFSGADLSVLALSSRFDGLISFYHMHTRILNFQYSLCRVVLMVLSLFLPFFRFSAFQYSLCRVVLMVSYHTQKEIAHIVFQYSLCRVVLMVLCESSALGYVVHFQYSLCRVVLMVAGLQSPRQPLRFLSVLALSSRFDGRIFHWAMAMTMSAFSTRSVESF